MSHFDIYVDFKRVTGAPAAQFSDFKGLMPRPKTQKTPVTPGTPAKPAGLSSGASIEWDRLLKEIQDAGIQITPAHRAAISLAATIAADIKADWKELEREGTYHTTQKGAGENARYSVEMHPAAKRMDALRRDYVKVLSVIGLRPGASIDTSEGDSLTDLLG